MLDTVAHGIIPGRNLADTVALPMGMVTCEVLVSHLFVSPFFASVFLSCLKAVRAACLVGPPFEILSLPRPTLAAGVLCNDIVANSYIRVSTTHER